MGCGLWAVGYWLAHSPQPNGNFRELGCLTPDTRHLTPTTYPLSPATLRLRRREHRGLFGNTFIQEIGTDPQCVRP